MMNRLTQFAAMVQAHEKKVKAVMADVRVVQSERETIMREGMKVLGLKKDVVSGMLSKVTVKEVPAVDVGAPETDGNPNVETGSVNINRDPIDYWNNAPGTVGMQPVEMLSPNDPHYGAGANLPAAADSVAIGNVQNAADAAE